MRATPPSRRDSLERHHGDSACILRYFSLLDVNNIHDDAIAQHSGQTDLNIEWVV
jgi:hypothetical protein